MLGELFLRMPQLCTMLENNHKIQSIFDSFEREIHKRRWVFGKDIK